MFSVRRFYWTTYRCRVLITKTHGYRIWHFCAQSLSHCELITDEGLRQIALSPCAAEHLAVLELDNCPNISDNGLNHLMQACHNLERIELYDCLHITREGIRKLRVLSPILSYISRSYITREKWFYGRGFVIISNRYLRTCITQLFMNYRSCIPQKIQSRIITILRPVADYNIAFSA